MALEKSIVEDKIEIYDRGAYKSIGVRTATIIKDDGKEISRTFHRETLNPNDDVSSKSEEVKKLAELYFTTEAKAEHQKLIDSKTGGPF
tara:strand:- start:45 stop:311 length:267 start_codon:yes stop_codon:yes gene_type:complete